MEKFEVEIKKTALKQLRKLPAQFQKSIIVKIEEHLTSYPHVANGKHIKKLTDGYRLRVGNFRIFYFILANKVIITSVVRRTTTTY